MIPTALGIDEAEVAGLVPEVYARFRPFIADALAFFLDRLSPGRLSGIVEAQVALPPDADISTRVVQLAHGCPALHKLGQVVARRRELDRTLRRRLQRLETMAPATVMDEIRPILAKELNEAIGQYRIELAEAPLAEASVAVVVPITWSEVGESRRRAGVVKVLKPDIAERMGEDLEILGQLAGFLEERRTRYNLPSLEYGEIFQEVRELLTHEIHFEQEQANLREAGRQYAGDPDVQIPAVLPFSTPRMTAMDRVFGVKVTDLAGQGLREHRRFSRILVNAIIAGVLFSRREGVLFHADAHAGNLFAGDDGRLAILDWSLTGRLTLEQRELIGQVLVGGVSRDGALIGRSIERLASRPPDARMLMARIEETLGELAGVWVPGPGWLMQLLDSLAMAGVRFPADLLLFRKTYFTVEGIFADVCGSCSLERTLLELTMSRMAGEWPARWFRPIVSRDYSTHLSTTDLLYLWALTPALVMEGWRGALQRAGGRP